MFKPNLTRLIISCVLLTASIAAGAGHLSDIQDNLLESWESETDNALRSSSGTITRLASLEYSTLCKDAAFAYSSDRLEYSYNATGRVELFVVDRAAFEAQLETGEDQLRSQGVILPDSYCLGQNCQASCNLKEVKDWCLVFWNLDKDRKSVNVTYLYHLSGGHQKSDQLVLILTLVCLALGLLLFGFCIGCCIVSKRRKNERSEASKETQSPQQVPLLQQVVHPSQDFMYPMPPPPPPPLPVMVPSGSHHSLHDAYFQSPTPLPVSHAPQSSGPPGVLNQEARAPVPRKDKRSKKPKTRKIRFPI